MCNFCYEEDEYIHGKCIITSDWKNTAGYNPERNKDCFYPTVNPKAFEQLEAFILKGKADKKAGLIINTISGGRYTDINFCPMCGRNLNE